VTRGCWPARDKASLWIGGRTCISSLQTSLSVARSHIASRVFSLRLLSAGIVPPSVFQPDTPLDRGLQIRVL